MTKKLKLDNATIATIAIMLDLIIFGGLSFMLAFIVFSHAIVGVSIEWIETAIYIFIGISSLLSFWLTINIIVLIFIAYVEYVEIEIENKISKK